MRLVRGGRRPEGYDDEAEVVQQNAVLDEAMKHLGQYERDNSQKNDPIADLMAEIARNNIPLPVKP